MTRERLARLLAEVSEGTLAPADALQQLQHFPTEKLEFAQLDHHRLLRQGLPEVVYAEGKSVEQVNADGDRDRWFTAEEALEYGFVDHIRASAADVVGGAGTDAAKK